MEKTSIVIIGLLFVGLVFVSGCTGSSGIACDEKVYEFNNCDALENCECMHTNPITDVCDTCECKECITDSTEIKVGKGCDSLEGCDCVSENLIGTCIACECQKSKLGNSGNSS